MSTPEVVSNGVTFEVERFEWVDGDRLEVTGRWSRGTLHASKIKNITTASEVVGFPRWLKWAILGVFLLVVSAGAIAVAVAAVGDGVVLRIVVQRGLSARHDGGNRSRIGGRLVYREPAT